MGVVTWCRLCAIQKEAVVEIFEDEGQKLNLETKIAKYLQIELYSDDPLPKSVCLDCCSKLDICSDFVVDSTRAQETLHMIFLEQKVEECDSTLQDERSKFMDGMPESNFPKTQETFPEAEIADPGPSKFVECVLDFHAAIGVNETSVHEALSIKEADVQPSSSFTKCDFQKQKQIFEVVDEKMNTVSHSLHKRHEGWEKYPWLCTDCSKELPSMQALRVHHQEEHKQPPRFKCAQCQKVYTKYYGFVSHVRIHRNHLKFCCEECGKCFSNKKVLESHRATHSDARPFVCSECGKSFRQQSALYVHTRSHQPDNIKNRYPCDQCEKRFSTKPNLLTHKRIHTGIRNFTCDQCGKSFVQKGNLDAHLLTHSIDKPYICSVCSKGFKTPLQLRKHQTVHTGAKPHQCDVCGRQFRERGTLREHHRIHTGAMPFICEFCGKSFRFKGILTTHRRQHTGERPYSCLECQHHFTNWPNYNKHMKRRHGINTSVQPDPNKLVPAASVADMNSVSSSISSSISHHQQLFQPPIYNQIHSIHDDHGTNLYSHMGHYVQTQVQAPTDLNFYNISQLHLFTPGNSIDSVHNR